MAPTTQKASRSISFTQAEADQALLAAIDQELAAERYSGFTALGKEALRQFLLAGQPADLTKQLEPITTQIARLSTQIEQVIRQSNQPLLDLQQQINRLEQTVSEKAVSQFSEFERLLTRLELLLEQREAKSRPASEPEPAEISSETAHEPDPVLNRLSRVLERF